MTTSENTRNLWCILPCLDESLEVTGLLPAVMCGIIDQRTREGKLSETAIVCLWRDWVRVWARMSRNLHQSTSNLH